MERPVLRKDTKSDGFTDESMPKSWFNIFKSIHIAAFLSALSILGDVWSGLQTIDPALVATIPSTHEHTLGMGNARVSYDFANANFAIAGGF